jgi:glycosyltransferase involved in cell wall biosynthesis
MKITFLMPGYMWGPSGGYRVVYEYANQLVSRGHEVAVVHPRHLDFTPVAKPTLRQWFRKCRLNLVELVSRPTIDWHPMDNRVRLLYVPSLHDRHIPDGDVLFATAWNTARCVLECPSAKGQKCYLIQHYETWMGPQALVDETWRMPLRKIVIARWLLELGRSLGSHSLTYIPNGIDHKQYQITKSIEGRPRQVGMMCSHVEFKRSQDGIAALQIAKNEFPDLRVVLFGNSYRPSWVPDWMSYEGDPPQRHIIEDLYNGSSIFLGPSLTEGFPLPPAEAAACGCAIVATDIGGHREYLQNGVTALLSPAKDHHALARNLCLLLANDELRIRLARSANDFIKQFTWERSTDLLEGFVNKTVTREPLSQSHVSPVEVSHA